MKNKTFTDKETERFEHRCKTAGTYPEDVNWIKGWIERHDQRLIEEIEREVIGEDDRHPAPGNSDGMKYRNQLRAAQRKKLAEYKV